MNFSGKFGSDQTIWYPASGYLHDGGSFYLAGAGFYWSVSSVSLNANFLNFSHNGNVYLGYDDYRAFGFSVRCVRVID